MLIEDLFIVAKTLKQPIYPSAGPEAFPNPFPRGTRLELGEAYGHHKSEWGHLLGEVEYHPYLNQSKFLEYCKSKDIVMTAYSALGSDSDKDWVKKGNPVLQEDPILNAIAEKHRRTPAQVALCYQLQRGVVVLVKSFNEKRIKENFQVFDFQLTPEDMKTTGGLNKNIRYL
ncbi:aldo-keto reductase family 1 member C15-like [Gorilla gorilla gorilla]|uniref:aldo-keto reductase family 1 member C15-like n=1 Tax=Gorilla gorilla gorilla TaxID=9595 RepID=UPI00300AB9B8